MLRSLVLLEGTWCSHCSQHSLKASCVYVGDIVPVAKRS